MIPGFLNLSQIRVCRRITYLDGTNHPRRLLEQGYPHILRGQGEESERFVPSSICIHVK